MESMFKSAKLFNGKIGEWPANSKTKYFSYFLQDATSFDQDLSKLNLCATQTTSWGDRTKIASDKTKHPNWKGACVV